MKKYLSIAAIALMAIIVPFCAVGCKKTTKKEDGKTISTAYTLKISIKSPVYNTYKLEENSTTYYKLTVPSNLTEEELQTYFLFVTDEKSFEGIDPSTYSYELIASDKTTVVTTSAEAIQDGLAYYSNLKVESGKTYYLKLTINQAQTISLVTGNVEAFGEEGK